MKSLLLAIAILLSFSSHAQRYRVLYGKSGGDTNVSNITSVKREVKVPEHPSKYQPEPIRVWAPATFFPGGDFMTEFAPICLGVDSVRIQIFNIEGKLIHSMYCNEKWKGTGQKTQYNILMYWYDKHLDNWYYKRQVLIENPME